MVISINLVATKNKLDYFCFDVVVKYFPGGWLYDNLHTLELSLFGKHKSTIVELYCFVNTFFALKILYEDSGETSYGKY